MTDIIKQRDNAWFELRAGKFTASQIYNLMGERSLKSNKDGSQLNHWSDGAQTYIFKKVSESFQVYEEEVYSKALAWGNDNEEYAKKHYSEAFSCELEDRAFIVSEFSKHAGCSPDSYIKGDHKGVEFKCPYVPSNHVKYMLIKSSEDLKVISKQYYWQIQMSMLISGFKKWDFVSYDPRFDGKFMMYAVEIQRDESDCELLKERILKAITVRDKILESINN